MKKLLLLLIIPVLGFSQNTHCGDRPLKPEKVNNETNKQYKNSTRYVSYKKQLKEWKYCVSPMGIANRLDESLEKKSITETPEILNPCGDKPKKPKRLKNQNVDEYRQDTDYIEYRQRLKKWKNCVSPIGNIKNDESSDKEISIQQKAKMNNPCGDKPKQPTRNEGLNHEEYRQTAEHIEYRKKLKDWRMCMKKNN